MDLFASLRGGRFKTHDLNPTDIRREEIRIALLANLLSNVKNGDTVDGVKISVANRVFQKKVKGIYHYTSEPINDNKLVLEHLEEVNNVLPSVSPGGQSFLFVDNFFQFLCEKLDNSERAQVKIPYVTVDKPYNLPGVKMLQRGILPNSTNPYVSAYGFPGSLFQPPLLGGSEKTMYSEHLICGSPIVSVVCPTAQGNMKKIRQKLLANVGLKIDASQNVNDVLQKERLLISPDVLNDWGIYYMYRELLPHSGDSSFVQLVDREAVKFSICTGLNLSLAA